MDRFDAIGDAGLRAALLFVRGMPAPVTANEAAAALHVHRNVARSRLERLLNAGLVETRFARRSGRRGPGAGRPAKLYAPAPEPRALEFPPRRLESIVGRLLEEIAPAGREAALVRVGEDYGRELAKGAELQRSGDARRGLERVCAALRSRGFPAVLDRVEADHALISTTDCPLRPLVREHSEAAAIDRGMWAGLVERCVRGTKAVEVECRIDGCCAGDGRCSVELHLRRTP